MAMYDEIEFLDSEILDDDADAPVGTLIHVLGDGTVEEVPVSHDVVSPVEDNSKHEENKDGNADQDEKGHTALYMLLKAMCDVKLIAAYIFIRCSR